MGKPVKSHTLRVALGLLCVSFVVSACLLPQNDDPLPDIPPQKNRPPRIDLSSVNPQRSVVNDQAISCTMHQNKDCPYVCAGVDDPDVNDDIRVRWVVYESDGSRAQVQLSMDPPQIGPSMPPT